MKKLIIAALVTFCGTALADDFTYMKHLEPKQTKTINLAFVKGKYYVEVKSDTDKAIFDCNMFKEDGQEYSKTNTNVCDFYIDIDINHKLKLNIKNDTIHPIDVTAKVTYLK